MLYEVRVNVPDRSVVTHMPCSALRVRNSLNSYLEEGVDEVILTVKKWVHKHRWISKEVTSDSGVHLECEECDETFSISETLLQAIFAGKELAEEHGF